MATGPAANMSTPAKRESSAFYRHYPAPNGARSGFAHTRASSGSKPKARPDQRCFLAVVAVKSGALFATWAPILDQLLDLEGPDGSPSHAIGPVLWSLPPDLGLVDPDLHSRGWRNPTKSRRCRREIWAHASPRRPSATRDSLVARRSKKQVPLRYFTRARSGRRCSIDPCWSHREPPGPTTTGSDDA